jgi:hypothetical protein
MPKMKPWYQVVTPREDLRENRPLDASEFAVHLDHIRNCRAHPDYTKPERFFERTFLTASLLDLSAQVVRRLSGIKVETSAVFNMATQFGGGKTHSLTALYHLANAGRKAKSWKGVDSILQKAHVAEVPSAKVAVFVGTEFDVLTGRGGNGEPVRMTPWGEIAWQLGKEDGFAVVREHDQQKIAPSGDVIRKMLPQGPVLILMDEMLNYVSRGRNLGLRDQFFNFLQNLAEESRGRDNLVMCMSIPASELEMNPEDQRDQDSLKKLMDRTGKAIMMSAETEVAEIIRRRLLEWYGLPEDGRTTAAAYADWAIEHSAELTGIDADSIHEKFRTAYPFHPSVLSVFERKWQALPRFQRTRGILRLLALWISWAYQEEHRKAAKEPLITLGSAPLEDPTFRSAVFEQLGSDKLEVPVTADIAGKKDSHSIRLDKEASEFIRKARLHQKVATTIFFESNGGQSQGKAEASAPEIKTAVGEPDLILAEVDNVLEGLVNTCFYLSWDRNKYRFSLSPNLNQMLVARRGAIKPASIDERIKKEIESLFKEGSKDIDRRYFPARSNDVPDRPELTLVVMGMDSPAGDPATAKLMETILRESGTSGRTFKSALIFAAPDTGSTIIDTARNLLAWEDIDDDDESKSRLDDQQKRQLTQSLGRAGKDLTEALWRAYRRLFILGKDNAIKEIDLGQITSSMAKDMVELILGRLVKDDEITESVGANKLSKYWPPALTEWSTKAARDAFYSSPLLPRLLKSSLIKRTIADGVTQGVLGYARKDSKDRLILERFKESLSELEVEIADDVYLLKAEDAQKLVEPPHLARLAIFPERASIRPKDAINFRAEGFDQYTQPYNLSTKSWSASGGSIDSEGLFIAEAATGIYTAQVRVGPIEATAEIQITKEEKPPVEPKSERVIRWKGNVPPQKWMNFYTKVLSRFAASPGLKLEVNFEAPAEGDQEKTKADEARSGLRELGLNDNVDIT